MERTTHLRIAAVLCAFITTFCPSLWAYSGGSGTAGDPYQIATADDLIALGNEPDDYDKHFILTADIDLAGYTFDRAVIAPDTSLSFWDFEGRYFTGVFSGDDHIIRNLHIEGRGHLGLFGLVVNRAVICNLGVENVVIESTGAYVGTLTGSLYSGTVLNCHCTGKVAGANSVGGLIGQFQGGTLRRCYSTAEVTGDGGSNGGSIGGLLGHAGGGSVTNCYSTGSVAGKDSVGGLVGNRQEGSLLNCYSTSVVTGNSNIDPLVGNNYRSSVIGCFWDKDTSGLDQGANGVGLTPEQAANIETYLDAGWDFQEESANGTAEIWQMPLDGGYPRLDLVKPVKPQGQGTSNDPFLITNVQELGSIGYRPMASYRLEMDLDLSGITWNTSVVPWFEGHFDGNGHAIANLHIQGDKFVGLFDSLGTCAAVMDLGLENGSIYAAEGDVGGLAGYNAGCVLNCYSTTTITGEWRTGGLVGQNTGAVLSCHTTGTVNGTSYVGGVVGYNSGTVSNCYSRATVKGSHRGIGGLVGNNYGSISNVFGRGQVTGDDCVGGLVGDNNDGSVSNAYSTGLVTGYGDHVGGLVGENSDGSIMSCFWDKETSGADDSAGGVGLTTDQFNEIDTFLEAGWDFVGEGDSGTAETWVITQAGNYPELSIFTGFKPVRPKGEGTLADPFMITHVRELGAIGYQPLAYYRLDANIDLSHVSWITAPVAWFGGRFDGNGHVIRYLHVQGGGYLGLFGHLGSDALVKDFELEEGFVQGAGNNIGLLAGLNEARLVNCHAIGQVSGNENVGGLVGYNYFGSLFIAHCMSEVIGKGSVGGLVGSNYYGSISCCYSAGEVVGMSSVGGVAGGNHMSQVSNCYSISSVAGDGTVGGLVGFNGARLGYGRVSHCYSVGEIIGENKDASGLVGFNVDTVQYSFWDIETSGQIQSGGGTGLTTAQMMDIDTYLDAGWDFVGETANGTEDIWWIEEGVDYPRLWWELGE